MNKFLARQNLLHSSLPLLLPLLLLLQLTVTECVTEVPDLGMMPPTEMSDFQIPKGLFDVESKAVHHQSRNHQLGDKEISSPATFRIPFDQSHFDFDVQDWAVYDEDKNETMIVSVSHDPRRELMIKTAIRPLSDVIISYQIHMTSHDNHVPPSFMVFLISNGRKHLLKEEDAHEMWNTSSLPIKTESETQTQLQFVGVLNSDKNQIALRSFTLRDNSSPAQIRYGRPSSHDVQSEHILSAMEFHPHDSSVTHKMESVDTTEDVTNSSVGDTSEAFTESDFLLTTTESAGNSFPDSDSGNGTNVSRMGEDISDAEMLPNDGTHNYTFDVLAPYLKRPIGGPNSSTLHPVNIDTEEDSTMASNESDTNSQTTHLISQTENMTTTPFQYDTLNSTMSSANETITSVPSSAKAVFNFFAVIMVGAAFLLGFLWWRRRRSKQDDEIPVFSRGASEHGNPTFLDDETNLDASLNSETPSNYKSFR